MEEDVIEKEDHDVEEQVDLPNEEVEPNVLGDNVLDNDIDDDIVDFIDDDNNMVANPFNVNSEVDDTDVDLDEEEDQWYWNVWGMWLYRFYDLFIEVLTW